MIIKQETYKVGDKIMIVELEALRKCEGRNSEGRMDCFAGKVLEVTRVDPKWYRLDDNVWSFYPDMIAGRVIDIVLHDGKAYKPVQRKAKEGELIKVVKVGCHDSELHIGDIHRVVETHGGAYVYTDHENGFTDDETHEYVTLEPIPCMSDSPHPEIAEGSTFVTVTNNASIYDQGDIVTLASNNNSVHPIFDNWKCIHWCYLAPVNIIYKQDKTEDSLTVEELREAKKTFDTQGYTPWSIPDEKLKQPAAMSDAPHPEIAPGAQFRVVDVEGNENLQIGDIVTLINNNTQGYSLFNVHRTNEKTLIYWYRLVPIDTCPACGQPLPFKRTFTPEQIAEARDIVYRIMMPKTAFCDRTFVFEQYSGFTDCWELEKASRDNWTEKRKAVVYCPDNTEWQDDIMRLLALCKLTGEKLPAWLEV
jgi:hypothetical protein